MSRVFCAEAPVSDPARMMDYPPSTRFNAKCELFPSVYTVRRATLFFVPPSARLLIDSTQIGQYQWYVVTKPNKGGANIGREAVHSLNMEATAGI